MQNPSKPTRTPNPDVRRLVAHYSEQYQRLHSAKPVIRHAIAGKAAQTLLAAMTIEEACALVTQFVTAPPDWHRERGCIGLEHLPGAVNQLRHAQASRLATAVPELDDTDRLIREQLQHGDDPRWSEYDRAVLAHQVPVGWDAWLLQRGPA
jgi:hypothetical protein